MERLELQNQEFTYCKKILILSLILVNDFMPTGQQIGSGQYPVGVAGAYHLGFFAAITVEADWRNFGS